jgi:tripartite-type tricarboxylate transporter receptor subunit TctC
MAMFAFRVAVLAVALATATSCARGVGFTEWPRRPVRVIVPFGPGSGADLVTRLLAPRLSERWRQPVVVDNRPGADGISGVQAFVSANDQHTLLFTPAGQVTLSPLLHDALPFDPIRDLVPIAAAVDPSIGIAVAKDVPVAALADLATLARSHPDRYLWGGVPGLPEIIFKAFLALEKVHMRHVPYRVQSMALQDVGAGRLHILTASVATLSPALQSGAARLLVVATRARIAAAPDVPTTTEAGYPVLTSEGRWGFYGWRDMPIALRDRISDDVRQALEDAGLAAKLTAMGLAVAPADATEFAHTIQAQRRQVHEIASIIGLKPSKTSGRP